MMKITSLAGFILASFLFTASVSEISAQEKPPRFEDYPVAQVYKGKNAPLKLDRQLKELHGEKLKEINREKVDFAGHYIAASWSCGMWCTDSAMIDAKTGKLYFWDGMLSVCLPDYDKDFKCDEDFTKIDSKLIVFFGFRYKNRNDEDGERGFHYYKFENGKFIYLKSILVKEQRSPRDIPADEKAEK